MYQVLRSGEPEMMAQILRRLWKRRHVDAEHREILRELGLEILHGGSSSSARSDVGGDLRRLPPSRDDVTGKPTPALAQEIARRAALAVDNARLYEEAQKEIAEREWAQEELRGSRDQLDDLAGCRRRHYRAGPRDGSSTPTRLQPGWSASSAREFMEAPPGEVMTRFEVRRGGSSVPRDFRAQAPRRRGRGRGGASLRVRAAEERWAIVKAMPIFGEQGRVRMAVNIFRDITEAKRAEDTLRRVTEAERSRIARDLHDGVLQDLSYTAAAGLIMLEVDDAELGESSKQLSMPSGVAPRASVRRSTTCASR